VPRNAVVSVGYLWGRVRDAYLWDFVGPRQRSPAARRAVESYAGHDAVVGAAGKPGCCGRCAVAGEVRRGPAVQFLQVSLGSAAGEPR
jgi:hypothetical protein